MADLEIVASAVGFDKVDTALKKTQDGLLKTGDAADEAANSFNKLKPGAAQATNAMTNLGRVVQDAPYGFIGIANNIDPLLTSFQNLQKETGSFGGALKALGGSLMGGGGLAFAVSAITSLMVVFGGSMSSATASTDELSASTEDFTRNINNAKGNLDALLMSIDTASKIKAIDFKIANADKGAQSVFEAANNVAMLDAKMVATNEQAIKLIDLIIKVEREYDKLRDTSEDLPTTIDMASKATTGITADAKELIKKWQELKDEQKKAMSELEKYPDIMKLARKEQELAVIEEKRQKDAAKKKNQTLDEYLALFREAQKDLRNVGIAFNEPKLNEQIKLITDAIGGVITKFNQDPKSELVIGLKTELFGKELEKFAAEAPSILQKEASKKPVDLSKLLQIKIPDFAKLIPPLKFDSWVFKTKEEFNKAFGEFQSSAIEDALITFSESIGDVITGKMSFGDAFKAVFASLGDNIKQLGQQLIKIAILTKIAQKTLFSNPTAALAAGVGLVILGSVLKNLMSKQAFATGTTFAPGGMSLVGERGPELVNLPRGAKVIPATQTANMMGAMSSVEVYGVLRGQDIYFSNKKYGQTYNRQA